MTHSRSPKRAAAQRHAEQDRRRAAKSRTNTIIAGVVIAVVVAVVAVTGALAMGAGPSPSPKAAERSAGVAAPAPVAAAAPVQAAAAPAVVAPKSAPAPKAKPAAASPKPHAAPSASPQQISIGIGASGYEPASVTAQAGRPVTLTVAKGTGCATTFLMPSLGVTADNSQGPATVSLGKLSAGTYKFTCGMGMIEGKLVVR